MWYSQGLPAFVCGLLVWPTFSKLVGAVADADKFDWTAIKPTTDLQYHPCYEGFRCARLQVPLDWLANTDNDSSSSNKTVAIAVITLPATVPANDSTFGGTIITNPGGPGGSGVSFMRGKGRLLQSMTEGKKHYEILSFDPRGVAYTTPNADCARGRVFARDSRLLEKIGIGGMDASESGLKRSLALDDAWGRLCETANADLDDILAHMSTSSVARDIVEIADRVEEQRSAELRTVLRDPAAQQQPLGLRDAPSEKKKTNRVLYWGFSYGTVLGNTLASMFPGRMGRVILDGNVDIRDFMAGSWLHNLFDTEEIVKYFYDTCFEASAECPLWKPEDRSGEDIHARLEAFFAQADATPFTFVPNDGKSSGVSAITGFDLRNTLKDPMYRPLPTAFEKVAEVLAEALKGNLSGVGYSQQHPDLQAACGLPNSTTQSDRIDAQAGVLCGDGDYANPDGPHRHHRSDNTAYWRTYVATLKAQSPTVGPYWASIASSCVGWRVQPKWRFNGPFTTPPANASLQQEGVPAAPILFTSSRLDPVTPLPNAYVMSNDHPGSAVLVLDTVGHCALGNGWSECFNGHIQAYLDDGTLPENGTVCADTTCKPFSKDGKCQPPPEVIETLNYDKGWDMPRFGYPLGIPF